MESEVTGQADIDGGRSSQDTNQPSLSLTPRSSVPSHRVIPVNEEQPTSLDVAGFITEWKPSGNGKNTLTSLTVELQSLEHHKTQYLDLHRELMKIDYSPTCYEFPHVGHNLALLWTVHQVFFCVETIDSWLHVGSKDSTRLFQVASDNSVVRRNLI
jgi:hypothetical protein